MVKVEIWDDTKFKLKFSRVERIDAVERFLKRIENDVTVITKIWGCTNFVKITTKDAHINIFFTEKQYEKFRPVLEKMNGGEIEKIYVR